MNRRVAILAVLAPLLASHMAHGAADVLVTTGIISVLGPQPVLLLWLLEALLAGALAAVLSSFIDRVDRRRFLAALLAAEGVTFAIVAALGAGPAPLVYTALAVISTVQYNVGFFATWALARDLFDPREAVETFGPLGGLSILGTLACTALPPLFGGCALGPHVALYPVALALFAAAAIVHRVRIAPHVVRSSAPPPSVPASVRSLSALAPPDEADAFASAPHSLADVASGVAFIARSRTLLLTTLLLVLDGAAFTVASYEVVVILAKRTGELRALEVDYAGLRFAEPLVHALVELLLAAAVLRRVRFARVFVTTPVALVLAFVAFTVLPRWEVAFLAACGLRGAYALESSALSSLLVTLPAPVRARVSTMIEGVAPPAGYALGAGIVGLLELAAARAPAPIAAHLPGVLGVGGLLTVLAVVTSLVLASRS